MKKLLVVTMLAMLVGCSDSSRLYFSEIEPALSTCMIHGGVVYVDVVITRVDNTSSSEVLFATNNHENYGKRTMTNYISGVKCSNGGYFKNSDMRRNWKEKSKEDLEAFKIQINESMKEWHFGKYKKQL